MSILFTEYLKENTLNESSIFSAHKWIKIHIGNQANILPIRATGKIDQASNARDNRAKLIHLDNSSSKIVYSDNELATWLYINISNNNFFHKSFEEYITEKIMPIADSRAKRESDGSFRLQSVLRPWRNIRHSHVFDAGLYSHKLIIESTREEIISRFTRLVHPINYFLFPDNLTALAEQNSAPEYQYVAAVYMKNKFPEIFEEFIDLIKPGIFFTWNNDWEKIGKSHIDILKMPHPLEIPPMQANNRDGAMIQRLQNNTPAGAVMNKGERDARECSVRKIPRGHGINEYVLKIGWWINGRMEHIGVFRFNLELLRENNVISVSPKNEYNFKIVRDPASNSFSIGGNNLP